MTNTVAKTIRTIVQVIASSGFLAAINAALNSTGRYLPGNAKVAMLGVLVPIVTLAHNGLEDTGMIGTWLRRPSLTPATLQKQAAKASAIAQAETDRLAAQTAKLAPIAAPIIDQVKTLIEAELASLSGRIDGIVQSLPTAAVVATGGSIPSPIVGDVTQTVTDVANTVTTLSPPAAPAGPVA